MFQLLSHRIRTTVVLATLGLSIFVISGSASAQTVRRVEFEVRTGGDNLRGGNDNAFVMVRMSDDREIVEQLNSGNHEIPDYHTTRREVVVPRGTQLDQIVTIRLFVEGFSGGFDGDNWNVDALRVTAILDDGRRVVLMNEFASPLIRFTGRKHYWWRYLR